MSSDDMRAIRMRIRERREELGLSYQGLAELTGMSKSTLQRYETGDIGNLPLDKLKVLSSALNCSPAYILGWDSSKHLNNNLSIPELIEKRAVESCSSIRTETLFDRIDAVCIYKGLSRRQVAAAAKISYDTFNKVMEHKATFSVVSLLFPAWNPVEQRVKNRVESTI